MTKSASSSRLSAFHGGIFTVATRWMDRVLGLVSTMLLARLLSPQDYGLVAMATVFVGLTDVLLDLGVGVGLIQRGKSSSDYLDTAWTLRLLQVGLVALLVFLAAPLVGQYYRNDQVPTIMRVMAFTILLGGFENIGLVTFQQNMEFGREFKFLLSRRLLGFTATIILAYFLRSYWALVAGSMATRLASVVLSYIVHPHRPRWNLTRARELLGFSQWMLVANIANFLEGQIDKFVIGRRGGETDLGVYGLAGEVAAIPTTDLMAPLNRVLLPALVTVRDDVERLKHTFLLATGVQILIGMPAGGLVSFLADPIVMLLLGEKWRGAIPLVQIMGLAGVVRTMGSSSGYLLLTLGHVRLLSLLVWIQVAVFCAIVFWAIPTAGILEIAYSRFCVATLATLMAWWISFRYLDQLRFAELLRVLLRPVLGCIAAWVLTGSAHWMTEGSSALVKILFQGGLSMAIYAAVVLGLWWIAGRPDGAESYVLKKLRVL